MNSKRKGNGGERELLSILQAVGASAPRDLFAGMPAPQVNVEVGLNGENLVEYVSTQQGLDFKSYGMSKWQPR